MEWICLWRVKEMKEKVYNELSNMKIDYEVVNHEAATTTLLADKYIEGKIGVRSKFMFMSDKKKRRFYLFILDDNKRLDIKKLSEQINEKGLRLGSEKNLFEKMNLKFGVVSLFGLLNNKDKDIKVYIDKELLNEDIITFHPNDNTATVFIKIKDMFKFIDNLGFTYEIIDM